MKLSEESWNDYVGFSKERGECDLIHFSDFDAAIIWASERITELEADVERLEWQLHHAQRN